MPTFQILPETYVRGLGQGFLPRGAYVVQTIADVEDHAKDKPNKRGVYFTYRVTHAYLWDAEKKTFVQDTKDTIGREIKTQVFYPEGNDNDRHAISSMVTVLIGYGAITAEQGKQLVQTVGAPFDFGPGMFTNRQAFLIYDPPPADAGPDTYQEVAWAPQAEFSAIIEGSRAIAWPQDRKSARAQAQTAANPAASSAGKMVPAGAIPTPGAAPTTALPTPPANPAGFAAPPVPGAPPATAAPGTWSPGAPAPGGFASPPPGAPPANGAAAGGWGAPPTAPAGQPAGAGRGW